MQSWDSDLWLLTPGVYTLSIAHELPLIKLEPGKTLLPAPFHRYCLADGHENGWFGPYLATRG